MSDLPPYNQLHGLGQLVKLLNDTRLVAFDFDGVFTDNTVYLTQDGIESVCCWRSDGIGLARMRDIGMHTIILSTEVSPVVAARASKLGISCKQGIKSKAAAILEVCLELGVDPLKTAFVGNDINDVPAFNMVGLPIAVADAYPEISPHVLYRTTKSGGHGAVREVCDLFFHAKQTALASLATYVP